ncbi:hypothetical protein PFISCL1PPCAC_18732, partial [Pristionchus fissidentatus]
AKRHSFFSVFSRSSSSTATRRPTSWIASLADAPSPTTSNVLQSALRSRSSLTTPSPRTRWSIPSVPPAERDSSVSLRDSTPRSSFTIPTWISARSPVSELGIRLASSSRLPVLVRRDSTTVPR